MTQNSAQTVEEWIQRAQAIVKSERLLRNMTPSLYLQRPLRPQAPGYRQPDYGYRQPERSYRLGPYQEPPYDPQYEQNGDQGSAYDTQQSDKEC